MVGSLEEKLWEFCIPDDATWLGVLAIGPSDALRAAGKALLLCHRIVRLVCPPIPKLGGAIQEAPVQAGGSECYRMIVVGDTIN